jgi:uncharacterized protein (TIGR02246 family)
MIRGSLNVAFVLTVAVMATSCAGADVSSSQAPQQNQAGDEQTIRAQVAASEAAINKRDFTAIAALYTPDGDAVIADGPRTSGGEAISQSLEAAWATASKGRQISIAVDSIRFPNADVAIVNTTASFSEGEPKEDRGTWVLVRSNGAWRVAALRVQPAERR